MSDWIRLPSGTWLNLAFVQDVRPVKPGQVDYYTPNNNTLHRLDPTNAKFLIQALKDRCTKESIA